MSITLEQIDQLRKRTNCSYEEAKILLEKHNGDVLEAIVEFERNQGRGFSEPKRQKGNFWAKVKELIDKGFETRVIIEDKDRLIMNLSVNATILFTIISGGFITLLALIFVLVLGMKLSFRTERGQTTVQDIFKDVVEKVERPNPAQASSQTDTQEQQNKDDGYHEVTID